MKEKKGRVVLMVVALPDGSARFIMLSTCMQSVTEPSGCYTWHGHSCYLPTAIKPPLCPFSVVIVRTVTCKMLFQQWHRLLRCSTSLFVRSGYFMPEYQIKPRVSLYPLARSDIVTFFSEFIINMRWRGDRGSPRGLQTTMLVPYVPLRPLHCANLEKKLDRLLA